MALMCVNLPSVVLTLHFKAQKLDIMSPPNILIHNDKAYEKRIHVTMSIHFFIRINIILRIRSTSPSFSHSKQAS